MRKRGNVYTEILYNEEPEYFLLLLFGIHIEESGRDGVECCRKMVRGSKLEVLRNARGLRHDLQGYSLEAG